MRKTLVAAALIALSANANAWWGGPWDDGWHRGWGNGLGDMLGDMFGDGDFALNMNFRGRGHGWGRGYGYGYNDLYDYYGPWWAAPYYGYAPYGYPYAPVAPVAPYGAPVPPAAPAAPAAPNTENKDQAANTQQPAPVQNAAYMAPGYMSPEQIQQFMDQQRKAMEARFEQIRKEREAMWQRRFGQPAPAAAQKTAK